MSRARKIDQLRALAASTTFPAEKASALAKADELEALGPDPEDMAALDCEYSVYMGEFNFPTFEEAMNANWRNQEMEADAIRSAVFDLNAMLWGGEGDGRLWAIPGFAPLVTKTALIQLWMKRGGLIG